MSKLKFKRLQKGITMVEIIISMALFSIISMMVLLAFTASSRMLIDNTNNNKSIDKHSGNVEIKNYGAAEDLGEEFLFEMVINADGSTIVVEDQLDQYKAGDEDAYTFRFYKAD